MRRRKLPDLLEETDVQTEEEVDEPPMYRVILHNDDYTPRAFVMQVLMVVFSKTEEDATQLMWRVHKNGTGLCGVYTYEIAESKVGAVRDLAKEYGFPLRTTMEPE